MKGAIILLCVCAVWAAPPAAVEEPLKAVAAANRDFAAKVYTEILKTNKGNLIFSPFSAEVVLALLSAGTNGPSYDELVVGLSLPADQAVIQKGFKEILPTINQNLENLKLLSANRIYAGKDVKLEPPYEKTAVDVYGSTVQNIDFAKNVEAANTINQWVEEQTNNKIKDLINKDDLGSDTALVLVNALYFSGKWQKTFSESNTRKDLFWKSAKDTVDVPFMSQTSEFNYYDNTVLGAQFLELPYEAQGLSMVIVLPHEKDGLTALESNPAKLLEAQPFQSTRVDVKLPKFLINSEIKFVDILKSLGVKSIFDGEKADLKGLSSTHKNLFVSNVIQKAFINVTETGTEAAAATAVIVAGYSFVINRQTPEMFHADHPFTYYIKKDDLILFGGRLADLK